jgi:hypothetical protein
MIRSSHHISAGLLSHKSAITFVRGDVGIFCCSKTHQGLLAMLLCRPTTRGDTHAALFQASEYTQEIDTTYLAVLNSYKGVFSGNQFLHHHVQR